MAIPTWRIALLAGLAAVAVLVLPGDGRTAIVGVNAALVALAIIDRARTPGPRRLPVHREHASVVLLDHPSTLTWTVDNPTHRAVEVRLADQLPPSLRAERRRVALRIPRRGSASVSTGIRPQRRGRWSFAEITVRVYGPWKLMFRQRTLQVPSTLRVYPPFRSREEADLRIRSARILEVGLRSAQGRGGGTEFESLREYRVDDEFRRIDWAATARASKPIVRTYRAERNQTVLVLLDSGRTMAGRIRDPDAAGAAWGDVPRLDHAMDGVLLVTDLATRLGDRAGLIAFGDRVRAVVPPSARRDQLGRVTEALHDLEPELAESDYHAAFAETLARFRRRALLVVLTDLLEEAATETLLPALPLVLRDHLVVVAGVRDPAVDRWARSTPTEASTAYRKAAAIAALDDRGRISRRLQALGAEVVDEPPSTLAARLGDTYLRAKATGRL